MATHVQMDAPKPPERSLAQMKASRKVYVEEADYPDHALHDRNREYFIVVIERDLGKVAIIDGDTREVLVDILTGYAVHVVKASGHHNTEHWESRAGSGSPWAAMAR